MVFRAFVELEPLGFHPRSRMPLALEYRAFFLDGVPLYTAEYWETGEYGSEPPPPGEVARRIAGRFFTVDVARRKGGDWLIIELGDAQVAGLPERADPRRVLPRAHRSLACRVTLNAQSAVARLNQIELPN